MRYCYCLFLSLKRGERWRLRDPDFKQYVIEDTLQTIHWKIKNAKSWLLKDSLGWPIETFKGKPVKSAIRIVCQNIRKFIFKANVKHIRR